jgi:abortive infection bacteriophage resistance protein
MSPVTIPFAKPATTYSQQVILLQSRGMTFADPAGAEFFLEQISYYRLAAYWLPFEADHSTHQFQSGTTFEQVLAAYMADRELRLLFLDAIERIEVSVRSHWAYQMAHCHGPHAHLEMGLASDQSIWLKNLSRLTAEIDRSNEKFIKHMKTTYQELVPPVWAACEVMSLGLLSNWYGNLKPIATRRAIADAFHVDDDVLASWLQHLSIIRNLCAHHSRLWNRGLVVTPKVPLSKPARLRGQFVIDTHDGIHNERKLYNTALLTLHLMDVVAPNSGWRGKLRGLLTRGDLDPSQMGFPANWQSRQIWL